MYVDRARQRLGSGNYGSEKKVLGWIREYVETGNCLLWELAEEACKDYFSSPLLTQFPHCTIWVLAYGYSGARKSNYVKFKTNKSIVEDDLYTDHIGTIYAFVGYHSRTLAVKIGYTSKDWRKYLKEEKAQHEPEPLSSKSGTKREEEALHSIHATLAWAKIPKGREWYFPTDSLHKWIKENMELEPGFDVTWKRLT